jgi:hypothetical protein
MKIKMITCEGSNPMSKWYPGYECNERLRVTENIVSVICWKCLVRKMPAPQQKSQQPAGFPRGWKFFKEFVHQDGTVYHKGILKPELFGTLPPTEIKEVEVKQKKKKQTLDDKIQSEFYQKLKSKKQKIKSVSKKTKGKK